ncbi:hypothetical protein [Moorena producens]|uniref:hypothetical protein n=1 Tax=Moorena producens TaxID=1155739 RepID=UPI000B125A98|nr:hypothetical protein [Moorena producens]
MGRWGDAPFPTPYGCISVLQLGKNSGENSQTPHTPHTPHTSETCDLFYKYEMHPSLLPTPYSLLPTPYSLLPTPCSLLQKNSVGNNPDNYPKNSIKDRGQLS